METKIDLGNLEKEDKEKIMARYKELAADSGDVYAWQFNKNTPPSARTFSSEEEALKKLGRDRWLSGIGRACFHASAVRECKRGSETIYIKSDTFDK